MLTRDEEKPDYRSLVVGKEYNTGPEGGLFASTPPLEALRWLLSEAATVEPATATKLSTGQLCSQKSVGEDKVILISDVSRAFFEAPMKRKVAVELPAEAYEAEDEGEDLVGVFRNVLVWHTRRGSQLPDGSRQADEVARIHSNSV